MKRGAAMAGEQTRNEGCYQSVHKGGNNSDDEGNEKSG